MGADMLGAVGAIGADALDVVSAVGAVVVLLMLLLCVRGEMKATLHRNTYQDFTPTTLYTSPHTPTPPFQWCHLW